MQTPDNLLKVAQSNALRSAFEPMQGRRRKAKLSGKFSISLLPSLLAQEQTELSFKRISHGPRMPQPVFHLWNIFLLTALQVCAKRD